jgi:hypothetical protein
MYRNVPSVRQATQYVYVIDEQGSGKVHGYRAYLEDEPLGP